MTVPDPATQVAPSKHDWQWVVHSQDTHQKQVNTSYRMTARHTMWQTWTTKEQECKHEARNIVTDRYDGLQVVEGLVHRSLGVKAEAPPMALLLQNSLQLISKTAGLML